MTKTNAPVHHRYAFSTSSTLEQDVGKVLTLKSAACQLSPGVPGPLFTVMSRLPWLLGQKRIGNRRAIRREGLGAGFVIEFRAIDRCATDAASLLGWVLPFPFRPLR